jgi:hypothetical protein
MNCFEWFCNAQISIAMDGQRENKKADEIAATVGIEFECLDGWLKCFKER